MALCLDPRMVYRLLHVSLRHAMDSSAHDHQRHRILLAVFERQISKPPLRGARQRHTAISPPVHRSRIGRIDRLALERMRAPEQIKRFDEVRERR